MLGFMWVRVMSVLEKIHKYNSATFLTTENFLNDNVNGSILTYEPVTMTQEAGTL